MNLRKLSKTTWLSLAGGIIAITVISLGLSYAEQSNAQEQLNQELSQAQLILAKTAPETISSQKDELETKLAESRAQLETLKASLSPEVENIESNDCLFDIAEKSGVEVIGTRSNPPDSQKLSGFAYSTTWLKVTLKGNVANINRFIRTWTEENRIGVVRSVKINTIGTEEVSEEDLGYEDEEYIGEEDGEDVSDEEVENGEEEGTGEEDEENTGDEEESYGEEDSGNEEDTGYEEEDTGEEEVKQQEISLAIIEMTIYTYKGG